MKIFKCFVFFFLLSITASAQKDSLLAIIYKRTTTIVIDSAKSYTRKEVIVDQPYPECATVGDKTSSILFYAGSSGKMAKKDFKKEMGRKVRHHTMFYNFTTQTSWMESAGKTGRTRPAASNFDTLHWQLSDISKVILGLRCTLAIGVNKNNDSTLLWYTTGLEDYKGKVHFPNAPGVVLAAETQLRGMLLKYEAINLFKYEGKLEFPEEAKFIKEN